jgi:hypothetical protein
MTRRMYDSVTASDIPSNATMVAGYVNGTYKWSNADWGRFPQAVKVRIATRANVNDGHVLDVEAGAASMSEAPGWVERRRAAGVDPTVYCSYSAWSSLKILFGDLHMVQPHWWIARYDGKAEMISGAVAKQYINPPGSGGHYDLSIVADYWPGVDGGNTVTDLNLGQGVTSTDGRSLNVGQCLGAGPWASLMLERLAPKVDGTLATVEETRDAVRTLATAGIDLDVLASKIAELVNASVAETVADVLQRRLES